MDRVLNTSDETKNKFEQQYTREINELKDRHSKELELTKRNLSEINDKRCDYLKERKEECERQVMKLENDLREKNKQYDELMFEFRKIQRSGDEEVSHLKAQVRAKTDELHRVQNLYEDNMTLVKETKLEAEVHKQKLDVLKSEYYKLEATNRQGSAEIRAELAVCKERLASYEMIEKELD